MGLSKCICKGGYWSVTQNRVNHIEEKINKELRIKSHNHTQAGLTGPVNKSVGNLLYHLATKLPRQFHSHLPLLVEYVASGQLDQEAKLTAAIKFVQVSCKGQVKGVAII